MIPEALFLTKGVGKHKERLQSFELALRDAGIGMCNIVRVSSIIPPNCKIISKEEGLKRLKPGQIVYIAEHHSYGENEKKAGDYAEDLAATMLATTLGINFDINKAWDERKKVFKMSGKIVETKNVTQTAIGDENGLWTTVIAAAVFIEKL